MARIYHIEIFENLARFMLFAEYPFPIFELAIISFELIFWVLQIIRVGGDELLLAEELSDFPGWVIEYKILQREFGMEGLNGFVATWFGGANYTWVIGLTIGLFTSRLV